MDAAQWPQGVGVVRAAENWRNSEKKARPEKEQALNCPRCNSTNTKFCYYNNYSLSQPRYFCKNCRRYWTAGGNLRNIPVGGSSRKNKRAPSSSKPSICTQKLISSDLNPPIFPPRNPNIHDGHEPNLSYNGISEVVASPFMVQAHNLNPQNPNSDFFPVSNSNSVISSGFPMHEQEPSWGFSLENLFENSQPAAVRDDPTTASRIVFPFEESSNYEFENDRGLQRDCSGFWSGMISGGSW